MSKTYTKDHLCHMTLGQLTAVYNEATGKSVATFTTSRDSAIEKVWNVISKDEATAPLADLKASLESSKTIKAPKGKAKPAPKAKAAKGKGKKAAPAAGAKPKVGSGAFIRELLEKGQLSHAEIVEKVHAKFPGSLATTKDVSWNKNKMKNEGYVFA